MNGSPRGSKAHVVFTIAVLVTLASLDNAAIAAVPPLYGVIAADLGVSEAFVGLVTGISILVLAVSALGWGFLADRVGRNRLLVIGTVIWTGMLAASTLANNGMQFLLAHAVESVGLGCIASVGFSLIGEFMSPRRRGIAMSFWGVAQGAGAGFGLLLGGMVGGGDWRVPMWIVAGSGLAVSTLYLLAHEPARGRMEPELEEAMRLGVEYRFRARAGDIWRLAIRPSNALLIWLGFSAQFAYGSLIWLPRLFAARAEAAGVGVEAATGAGALFAAIFQIGGLFSIVGGHVGDRIQSRMPGGRALVSGVGILAAIPFFLAMFFVPFHGLTLPEDGTGTFDLLEGVARSFFTSWTLVGAFALALAALMLTSVDSPNSLAIINDVNLPEHRGTVAGLIHMGNGFGRATGNAVTGVAFGFLAGHFESPMNFAVGLAIFQACFIPTGIMYLLAMRTTPRDARAARIALASRARAARAAQHTPRSFASAAP